MNPAPRFLLCLALAPGCAPGPAPEDPSSPAAAPPDPVSTRELAAPEAAPTPAPAPANEPAPAPVDLKTVSALRFKIVAIPNRKHWVPCGLMHSIGALEVEVLDAGEPPPRMLLLVSCPTSVRGVKLEVGETMTATLHRRRQPWPGVHGLPPELVRRQVASLTAVAADASP